MIFDLVDWDEVAWLIDPVGGSVREMGDDYIEIDTNNLGWFRLQKYMCEVTVESDNIPNMSPVQETALGYLKSTGIKPLLFEIAVLNLDDFANEGELARRLMEIFDGKRND